MDTSQDNKRYTFHSSRSGRLSSRIVSSERGSAFSFDGFAGLDGISASIEDRKQGSAKEPKRRRQVMKFVRNHPISCCYWIGAVIVGLIWQGWVPGI